MSNVVKDADANANGSHTQVELSSPALHSVIEDTAIEGRDHLRSKIRTEPSADTDANTPTPPQAMSYTSLSWAISWVSTTPFCNGQVHNLRMVLAQGIH